MQKAETVIVCVMLVMIQFARDMGSLNQDMYAEHEHVCLSFSGVLGLSPIAQ
jgi:hypothetical protein